MSFSKKRVALFLVAIFPSAGLMLMIVLLVSCDTQPEWQIYRGEYMFLEITTGGNRAVRIDSYIGHRTNLHIPSHINNLPVIRIGPSAFSNRNLTNVIIPDHVTTIDLWAFKHNRLTSVVIPESVTYIGEQAFRYNQLVSIVIPNSVVHVRGAAFANNYLTKVIIPDSVTVIHNVAFRNNRLAEIVIPCGVAVVGILAFAHNLLTSVTIPDSITHIGLGAFEGNDITEIVIGPNVFLGVSDGGGTAFPHGFDDFYRANESRAGTFTFGGYRWHAEFRE